MPRVWKSLIAGVVLFGVFLLMAPVKAARAQAARTTKDGIFTMEQAKRGQAIYSENCMECHGRALEGDVETRPLNGYLFINNWTGLSLLTLFDRIRITMPGDRPGVLDRQKVADVLAFILLVNDFPAGKTELTTRSEVLQGIRFEEFKP